MPSLNGGAVRRAGSWPVRGTKTFFFCDKWIGKFLSDLRIEIYQQESFLIVIIAQLVGGTRFKILTVSVRIWLIILFNLIASTQKPINSFTFLKNWSSMKNLSLILILSFISVNFCSAQLAIHSSPDTIKNYNIKTCTTCEKSPARYRDKFQESYPVYFDLFKDEIFYLNDRFETGKIVHDRIKLL